MSDLEEQKIKEEIALLKVERRSAKVTLYLELSKAIVVFFGAILVFGLFNSPNLFLIELHQKKPLHVKEQSLCWI